jgi:hypothetical protein
VGCFAAATMPSVRFSCRVCGTAHLLRPLLLSLGESLKAAFAIYCHNWPKSELKL